MDGKNIVMFIFFEAVIFSLSHTVSISIETSVVAVSKVLATYFSLYLFRTCEHCMLLIALNDSAHKFHTLLFGHTHSGTFWFAACAAQLESSVEAVGGHGGKVDKVEKLEERDAHHWYVTCLPFTQSVGHRSLLNAPHSE
jgi:hypothetical protein